MTYLFSITLLVNLSFTAIVLPPKLDISSLNTSSEIIEVSSIDKTYVISQKVEGSVEDLEKTVEELKKELSLLKSCFIKLSKPCES